MPHEVMAIILRELYKGEQHKMKTTRRLQITEPSTNPRARVHATNPYPWSTEEEPTQIPMQTLETSKLTIIDGTYPNHQVLALHLRTATRGSSISSHQDVANFRWDVLRRKIEAAGLGGEDNERSWLIIKPDHHYYWSRGGHSRELEMTMSCVLGNDRQEDFTIRCFAGLAASQV